MNSSLAFLRRELVSMMWKECYTLSVYKRLGRANIESNFEMSFLRQTDSTYIDMFLPAFSYSELKKERLDWFSLLLL